MKKTGLEIVEMIAKGEAPKKIKDINSNKVYDYAKERFDYETENEILRITSRLNDEFEIIEEPKVWKPKYDEEYWYIDNNGVIRHDYWLDVDADEFRYNIGDCFKTQGETIKAKEKAIIKAQLKRYAEEHNEENIDWNNGKQDKWYIYFDVLENKEKISNLQLGILFYQVYFTSKELCGQAIKEIGEDNIKKLFEE